MNTCKNCNESINGNYCSNCGQSAEIKKINRRYIFTEIADVLFVNRGMFDTIKNLLIKPGISIRRYITGDRSRFVRPISFVVVTSLIYTIANYFFPLGLENFVSQFGENDQSSVDITKWAQENSGYTNLFIGLFMAFGIKLFFRKAGYNLSEIYVLICYVFGLTTLFDALGLIFQAITHLNLFNFLFATELIYITWAVGQFFHEKKVASYMKAFLSLFFGFLILSFLLVLVGIMIAIIKLLLTGVVVAQP